MYWDNYIPDLTERFPEGFDGVDMLAYEDPWAHMLGYDYEYGDEDFEDYEYDEEGYL